MAMRFNIIYILSIIVTACSTRHSDSRLDYAATLIDNSPHQALEYLTTIDSNSLPDADRHYYDFLSIKTKDKAYLPQSSDSLILDVIDYYSRHDGEGIYPETLYYGGRVYSDLGDYPSALKYFHEALNLMPDEEESADLKRRALSQTGRLLDALYLFDEAIPYIEAALEIKKNDTIAIIYDLQLLGGVYLRAGNYKESERIFKKALELSTDKPNYHNAKSKMYIAANKLNIGDIDSALYYIRGTIDSVKPIARNTALGFASDIYLQAGIIDTAYMYAHELVTNEDPFNKEVGYELILDSNLRRFSNESDIDKYIDEYRATLCEYYDNTQMQLALNQQNSYNYQLHVKEREKAEKANQSLKYGIGIALLIAVIALLIIMYLRNRDKNHIIELHEALENLKELNYRFNIENQNEKTDNTKEEAIPEYDKADESSFESHASKEDSLREKLKKEMISLYEKAGASKDVHSAILQSEVYQMIQNLAAQKRPIKDEDNIWEQLEKTILRSSPNFRVNFNLLSMGKHSLQEYHTALLIKSGFKPIQMSALLGRSPATVGSRREALSLKMLDQNLGTKAIDSIIRLL